VIGTVHRGWQRLGMALVGVALAVTYTALRGETRREIQSAPVPRVTSFGADIEFYERRIAEDPLSAADRARLAGLYLHRARETGSVQDYDRVAELARESLALRTAHNGDTYALLTAALLAKHDFSGAVRSARALFETDSTNASYRAQLAEVELELGNYEQANRLFTGVAREADKPTIAARVARWYEVTGRLALARGLLRRAADRLTRLSDVPREQVAWFHYRVGELEMRAGRFASADSALTRALEIFPGDYRALGALARLSAAQEDWASALDYGARAIAIQLDPATLGTMSDAYAALGDSVQARSFADAMAASALSQPGAIHRAWGLFLLDHGRDVERVLAEARSSLDERRDVYTYDLLAWALYRAGRVEDARRAAAAALAQGTEDAQLYYHAGMIALAARDTAEGRALLERALALNPRVSATAATASR
jgi:tetratricopeptide (TPR) repeat protein